MIIGIAGRLGSGKDTVGEVIQKLCLTNNGVEFEIKKFAGKLKTIASLVTGVPVEKFEDQEFKQKYMSEEWNNPNPLIYENGNKAWMPMTYREFLQKLGTEAMRDGLHTNVWVNALFADYKMSYRQHPDIDYVEHKAYPNWIITDVRFPNEVEAVEEREGITIRVVRGCSKCGGIGYHKLSCSKQYEKQHPSETALDDAKFDYEIINDGTLEDLVEKVKHILTIEKII